MLHGEAMALMAKSVETTNQISLAECVIALTIACFFAWLVVHPHNLLIVFLPPAVVYFLGEAWRARRVEWTFGRSVKIALLSAVVSAPLTGISAALHGSENGIASVGVAAFLGGTLFAAIYGLMPAFTALVIYFVGRDIFLRVRDGRRKASRDLPGCVVESRGEGDPMKASADDDKT